MLKKLNKKFKLLTVMITNTFLCLIFSCGCDKQTNKVSLAEKSVNIEESTKDIQEKTAARTGDIYVYVSGAVKKPGVYVVKEGSRVFQVIKLAGGMIKSARKDCLNQAETVIDGQNIKVFTKEQYAEIIQNETKNILIENNKINEGKININNADVALLMQLTGIGETKAKAIVSYREEHGNFSKIEEIKNVSGIGDSTFSNIRSNITVN